MAKDEQEKALMANGVEAGTIWSERPQEVRNRMDLDCLS
ncbi:hypothetical protein CCACVL1_14177 [Corchorus capsularis]|uniref:Uncharacterized protein n=1 Tax=Corchorus capsularis TaxID=210143 RepID=A0A1R3I7Y0_COCAP|nr:hypothetical protein CCACVL1_14177 [Corchorus capsularis]